MDLLTKSFTGFSIEAIGLFIASMLLYFFMEYKTKSGTAGWSTGYWIMDNWINLVISIFVFFILIFGSESISARYIVALGMMPNYAMDIIQTLMYKYKSK